MIDPRFFQVTATGIPTLMIAFAFTGGVLKVGNRRTPYEQQRLSSRPVLIFTLLGLSSVVLAEMLALVTVATGRETAFAFWVVLAAIGWLLSSLVTMAVYELVQPLARTSLAGMEVVLFPVVTLASTLGAWFALG